MYTLIDRGNGAPLVQLSPSDFEILQEVLVQESEQDFDYYFNPGSLQLLEEAGLSAEVLEQLRPRLEQGGVDAGWEQEEVDAELSFEGTVTDEEGGPVGGIRVDAVSPDGDIAGWAYSRIDGRYTVQVRPEFGVAVLRASGRGDLVLEEVRNPEPGETYDIEVQTLTGTVVDEAGAPIPNVSVHLLGWKEAAEGEFHETGALGGRLSWGDTDVAGRFAIPARIDETQLKSQVVLEVLAASGQTLRKLGREFVSAESLELGEFTAERPSEEWGGEPVKLENSVAMYPGVSERPLG